jgi:hypothetical protein
VHWVDSYIPTKSAYQNDAADGTAATNGPDGYDNTWTDTSASVAQKFYRIVRTTAL